jgi:hypothetical protein
LPKNWPIRKEVTMSDNVKGPLRSPAKRISHFHRNRRSIKEQSAKTDLS